MRRFLTLVMAAVIALGTLTACGGGGGGGAPAKEMTIEMGENGVWIFEPATIEVKKGETVKVTLINKDPYQPHSFVIPRLSVKSQQIAANRTGSVTFTPDKAGEFEVICDVPGHKEAGMVGTIIVK